MNRRKAQALRIAINSWYLIKLNSLCTAKDAITQVKMQPPEREKILTNFTSDIGLLQRMNKVFRKLNKKTPIKIGA